MTGRFSAAKTVVPEPYRKSLPSGALGTVIGALGSLRGPLSWLPLPSPKLPAVSPVGRLPVGRIVELPGRGSTYVADSGPAAEGPTFVLLHAVACTGLLTWYPALVEHHHASETAHQLQRRVPGQKPGAGYRV